MILCTTIRKLAASGKSIYKVTLHAAECNGVMLPQTVEFFATRKQAEVAAVNWAQLGSSSITIELADMDKHYMRT